MHLRLAFLGIILVGLCVSLPAISAAPPYLKEMPNEGEVRFGEVVYVDDGGCKPGEIKEVTGGNRDKSIPRTVRCVKRPEQRR